MPQNPVNSLHSISTSPRADEPRRAVRIEALDWVKGALVIFMVIYHGINYSAFRPFAFQYLSFVPPSFILIAGFLVGQVYATKYNLKSWKPYLRLAFRGLKLLALFMVLNIVNCILIEKNFYFGFWLFVDHTYDIFVSGNGRVGVFEVLLPIAYFLLLAPALLWLRGQIALIIPILAGAVFLLCIFLECRGTGLDNLSLLSSGFIGMALGLVSIRKINRFAANWIPVLLAYLGYRLISHFYGETYAVQVLAAIVSLAVLYCIGVLLSRNDESPSTAKCFPPLLGGLELHGKQRKEFAEREGSEEPSIREECESLGRGEGERPRHWSWRQMVLLGNYSLFGYLAQIILLRVVVIMIGGLPQNWGIVCAVVLITTLFLFLLLLSIDKIRRKNNFADMLYRAAFA